MRRTQRSAPASASAKLNGTIGLLVLLSVLFSVAGVTAWPATAFEPRAVAPAAKDGAAATKAAQPRPARKAKEKPSSAEAEDLVIGVAAAQSGRHEEAIQSLTTAIDSGRLKFNDTARALYYRGVSYRHTGELAKAISDLTNALWKKGALGSDEQKAALAERAAAYRAAGLDDLGVASTTTATAPAVSVPVAARAPVAEAPAKRPPQTGSVVPHSAWATRSAAPSASQQQAAPPPTGGGGFFSNLFNFGGTASTASEAGVKPAQQAAQSADANQTSSWSTTPRQDASVQRRQASAAPRPPAAPMAGAASGRFAIQVAAFRNRGEAEASARQVGTRHASLLASRQPAIVEHVLGNMGTMYVVRIGPYRSAQDTAQLCGKLRSEGLDCLLVDGQ